MPITPIAGGFQRWLVESGIVEEGSLADWLLARFSGGIGSATVAEMQWRRFQIVWTRTSPATTTEDRAIVTFDIVNLTGGVIDPTWTAADYTNVTGKLTTWINLVRGQQAPNISTKEIRAYAMAFSPTTWPKNPFAESGPPVNLVTLTPAAGSGTGALPYQVAISITERTPLPHHWGRVYVPSPAASCIDSMGRVTAGVQGAFANGTKTLADNLASSDFYLVVPMTQHNKAMAFGLSSVEAVAVDDVPDVQRSRRAREVATRTVVGLT